jgi:hypothetical protein
VTEPVCDVREIARIAYGFMASRTLFAALHLDLFDVIPGLTRLLAARKADPGRP